jgi:dUTP pyrophosphatase
MEKEYTLDDFVSLSTVAKSDSRYALIPPDWVAVPSISVDIVLTHPSAVMPEYASSGASGFDLRACFDEENILLKAGTWQLISSGYKIAVPRGFEIQVRPRSGLALKHGIVVKNSPGTVDADYRGELGVILYNESSSDFLINRGERIAQAVVCPIYQASFNRVESLSETERGTGGFGSTGVK